MIRLDLGVVENVVQNHEQRFGRRAHQLERAALLLGQLGIENQLHEAQHGVHRRADLVAHVGQECRARPGDALGQVAGLAHDSFGALRGFLADRQARRHLQVVDEREMRATRHNRHPQGEHGHDDGGREMVALIAGRQGYEDRECDAREESADAQRIGRERRQGTGDEAGQDDEDKGGGFEGHEGQHDRAPHAPGDGHQGHGGTHAGAHRLLAQRSPRRDV